MASLLKDIYSIEFFEIFTKSIKEVIKDFKKDEFLSEIFNDKWQNLELKQRMRHITITLKKYLTNDYQKSLNQILEIIKNLRENGFKDDNLEFIFFPDFIELYGIDHYQESIKVIPKITQFATCEFAIRPFIIKYPEKVISEMIIWSKDKNLKVRRLSSEGCRPRLPWAIALPKLKNNPEPILQILENLKNDPSEYVRRSVANNLNDIAKDNPEIVVNIVKKWIGKTLETDKLVKHASRTLLKQGNSELMTLFGFGSIKDIETNQVKIIKPKIKIGESLEFNFELVNKSNEDKKIRLEYAIYFQKSNGKLNKKVFKISERSYSKNSKTEINRKQPFKIITTRKLYSGLHKLSLIINGNELDKVDFYLD